MSWPIFRHALWSYRFILLFIAGGIVAFETLLALVWQSLGEGAALGMVDLLPPAMRHLMEAQFGMVPSGGISGWLAGLNRHPIYLVMISAFIVWAGVSTAAREVERGTILLVLSRPITRSAFLLAKFGAAGVGLAFLMAVTLGGLWAGGVLAGEGIAIGRFAWVSVNAALLFATLGGITTVLSAMADETGYVASRAGGLILAAYFLDFLANLWSNAEFVGPVSPFHYYDPAAIVGTGAVPWPDLAALLVASVILYGAALIIFRRRDISR